MFDQVFALSDIPRIFILSFIELVLSTDNALVLGVLTHSLPKEQRKKALFIGIGSAFILRLGALLGLGLLLEWVWIQFLGSLYLIYLSVSYFFKKARGTDIQVASSFWKTVFLIEMLDLIFAIDSILAGIAFIDAVKSKIWIVYFGGVLGIIGMRWAADLFSSLLDKFPHLEKGAHLMVGWVGVKLGLSAIHEPLPAPVFWSVLFFLFLLGFYRKNRLS